MLQVLANKHFVIAMIVTPILAVLAWIAVGQVAGEQPQPAKAGQAYPLIEQSNCRYESDACDLSNEDFKLRLTMNHTLLNISASHPLEGVLLAVGTPGLDLPPGVMNPASDDGTFWQIDLGRLPGADEKIRVVARASGSDYFAEASTTFLQEE